MLPIRIIYTNNTFLTLKSKLKIENGISADKHPGIYKHQFISWENDTLLIPFFAYTPIQFEVKTGSKWGEMPDNFVGDGCVFLKK